MLFGDKFQNYITKTVKTCQNSEEFFKSMNKGKSEAFRQDHPPQKTVVGIVESIIWEDQVQIAKLYQSSLPGKALQAKVH